MAASGQALTDMQAGRGPNGTRTDPAARLGLPPLEGFRPDIQALRGLAVLLVVLYHAKVVADGGFVGVDVFFVISGFVIGRRLISRLATSDGGVLGEFYLHRARRILPALSALLVFVILAAPLLSPIGLLDDASPTGIAAALFGANAYLYDATAGGYFAPLAELNPLLHTWSLSVEEQFYFAIPVMLLGTWFVGRRRWGSIRSARVLVGALLVSSFLLCAWFSGVDGKVLRVDGLRFAFFSPFTRAWEFAAGLLLVLVPVNLVVGRRWRTVLLAAGLAMIAVAALAYSDTTRFPGFAALVPVVGTALVIHAGTCAVVAKRRPGARPAGASLLAPMTFLGDVSYSWYLWHWPLIVFAGAFWPGSGRWPLVVAGAVSLLPATWSYRWLERRLRATPSSRARPTMALAGVCIAAPLVAALVAVPIRSFVRERAQDDFRAVADSAQRQVGEAECNTPVPYGARPAGSCSWGVAQAPNSVVLIGDSNAGHFSNALIGAAEATGARLEIAVLFGCPFLDVPFEYPPDRARQTTPAECVDFTERSITALEETPPDVVVLATSTDEWVWLEHMHPLDPRTGDPVTDLDTSARIVEESLVRLTQRLRAAGSRVVLLDVVPKPRGFDPRSCSNLAILVDAKRCLSKDFTIADDPDVVAANALFSRIADRVGIDTWSFADEICPDGSCRPVQDGRIVWRDGSHISAATSDFLVPAATRRLEQAFGKGA